MSLGGGEIERRQRVRWQADGSVERMGAKRRLRGIDQSNERVAKLVAIEIVDHIMATAGIAAQVENDIGAHARAEDDASVARLVGFAGLTIERNDERAMSGETECHKARDRGVDDAKAYALTGLHMQGFRFAT